MTVKKTKTIIKGSALKGRLTGEPDTFDEGEEDGDVRGDGSNDNTDDPEAEVRDKDVAEREVEKGANEGGLRERVGDALCTNVNAD
ncbi:hypothetical protein HN51_011717 [Arachis hypogaea]